MHCCESLSALKETFSEQAPDLVILDTQVKGQVLGFAAELSHYLPAVPFILLVHQENLSTLRSALEVGASDCITLPVDLDSLIQTVRHTLEKATQRRDWILLEARRATQNLSRRIGELETLARLAQNITASLDLDSVLTAVVSAAVELTGAEEGSLMLLDVPSGELYIRAARNFNEDFVRTFRLQVDDSLAGNVLSSGQPILLDQSDPQKITTTYMVHSLIYVPLQMKGQVNGILGVDNRSKRSALQPHDLKLMQALAEFATVALENAHLYTTVSVERNKMEAILSNIQDGVVVVDADQNLIVVNDVVRKFFHLKEVFTGQPFRQVFHQPELFDLLHVDSTPSRWTELTLSEDVVLEVQVTPIPAIGKVIVMHDISHLKKLDRMKSDFVNTVSHDLRSPLTTILGYAELIERVDPVTTRQHDFIIRLITSAQSITCMTDDLLNLGRIEAGFDVRLEEVKVDTLVKICVSDFQSQINQKNLQLTIQQQDEQTILFGYPVQLRQLLDNLLENAVKYTPANGSIQIQTRINEGQLMLLVKDSGIGIPTEEQSRIFEKFYRASNVDEKVTGTGLGLSIVKSIVDNHHGRIWVDSHPAGGTAFTILLPIDKRQNGF